MKSRIFLMFWQIITAVWQISVDLRVSGLICRRWDASLKIFGRMEKSPIPLVRKVIRAWENHEKNHEKREVEWSWSHLNHIRIIWKMPTSRFKSRFPFVIWMRPMDLFFPFQIFHLWHIYHRHQVQAVGMSRLEQFFIQISTDGSTEFNWSARKKKSATISKDPPWVPRWLWRRARAQRARPERFGPNLRPPISCIGTSHPSHPITIVP